MRASKIGANDFPIEQLFQCRVDLVTEESIRNPDSRREIEATRRRLYEQPREEIAL